MAGDADKFSPIFRIDVSPNVNEPTMGNPQMNNGNNELTALLQQLVISQDRTNDLLEDLVDQMGASQRQRANELGQWKEANPMLARKCRAAAEALSQVQTEFLENLTYEVSDNFENLLDGEFVLNEFVDRYGPRLAHLNGVLQLLSQLSAMPHHANSEA
ncbi:MAG: hypothetical protein AAGA30_20330 [Planctomycetota bacterium]